MKKRKELIIILTIILIIGIIQLILYKEPYPKNHYYNLSKGFIAYETQGEGEEIIMIHGSPGSKDDFKSLKTKLPRYKLYMLDMYGFGDSQKKVDDYSPEVAADIILEFMEKENIERANILGYSWGGLVAIDFAYKYPERISNLILLDSSGIQKGEPTGNHFLEKLRTLISYPFVVYYPGVIFGDEGWRKGFARSFYDTDQRTFEYKLSQIETPTLILHGDKDTVILPWVAQKHNLLLKNSKLEFFNGGHVTIFSKTGEMGEKIKEYLNEN